MLKLGSFAIIIDNHERVLLCHRRDIDAWNLPGGGVEPNELPPEAVIREVLEETGLDIEIERLAGIYLKPKDNELVFSFVCNIFGGEHILTDEADLVEFFDPNKLPVNTFPMQVERIRDAISETRLVFREQEGIGTLELLRKLGMGE